MSEQRLCVDCAWHFARPSDHHYCERRRPPERFSIDPVTGRKVWEYLGRYDRPCSDERESRWNCPPFSFKNCGPKGRFFKPITITQE